MRKALLVVLILSSAIAWAQGGCTGQKPLNGVTTGGYLQALANQKVRVCSDTLNPCTTVPLFSDAALTQVLANPVTTDAAGNYQYCAAVGAYNEQITSTGSVFAQVNNTPVTISGSGDVTGAGNNAFTGNNAHSGNETFTGVNRGFFTPNYFYAGDSFKMALAMRAIDSPALGSATQKPTHILVSGDSLMGLGPAFLKSFAAQYGGTNSTGFIQDYNNVWSTELSTYSIGAGCVLTRDDATSTSSWGPYGGRADCPSGQTLSIKSTLPSDSFHIWYNNTSGGGTFTWSVDGGSTTTVNTDSGGAADSEGVVTVTGLDGTIPHLVTRVVTAGNVRFYGTDFALSTQGGLIFDIMQSGGSQASQWNGHVGYLAQFIATVNPAYVILDYGANDGPAGRTAAQFGSDLSGIVSGLGLTASQAPIILTNTWRATSPGVEDLATNAIYRQYRSQIISLAQANNWSVFDFQNKWPDYTTASNAGLYNPETPEIHWSPAGVVYLFSGLAKELFAPLADAQNPANFSPAGRNLTVGTSSSGSLFMQLANSQDRGVTFSTQAGKTADQTIFWNMLDKAFGVKFQCGKDASNNFLCNDSGGFTRFILTGTGTMRLDVGTSVLARTANGGAILATLSDATGKGSWAGGIAAGSTSQFGVDASGNVATSGTVTSAGVTASTGLVQASDTTASAVIGKFGITGNGFCFYQNAGATTSRTNFLCQNAAGQIIFSVDPANGVKIGLNGSTLSTIITATGTLTYTAIAAQTCQEQPLTVTNSSTTNFGVSASPRATLGNVNLSWSAWVSAAGTVSVRVCNVTTGSITPAAVAWGVTVNQ